MAITISAVVVAFRPIQIRVANGIAIKSRYPVIVICQYLYYDSKLFTLVICFLVETRLWGTVLGREKCSVDFTSAHTKGAFTNYVYT